VTVSSESALPPPRAAVILHGAALAVLLSAVALSPLPIGCDAEWAQATLLSVLILGALLWIAGGIVAGRIHLVRSVSLFFIGAFLLLVLVQQVELPRGVLETLSPSTPALRGVGTDGVSGAASVSFDPYDTRMALYRCGGSALAFVALAGLLRSRRAVRLAIGVFLAAALFQVGYAVIEHASGGDHVFWVKKLHYRHAFTGTFFHKNHFAGFVEMVLPLAAAMVLAVRSKEEAGHPRSLRVRIAQTLNAKATHQRLLLGVIPILLAVGVALSMSRFGLACAVISLVGLCVIGLAAGGRGRSALLLALLLVIGVVGAFFVWGAVSARFAQGFQGRMFSLYARLDLLRSAVLVIRDFPVFGVGFGALDAVFGRYQSANLGSGLFNYIDNDWAQLTCETGIIGLLLVLGGLLSFGIATLRAALGRRHPLSRWAAVGALMGAFAMACHSLTDFNLSRTPSNGLLFAALLALAHGAAHASPRRSRGRRGWWTVPLRPLPIGVAVAVLAVAGAGLIVRAQSRRAGAERSYDRALRFAGRRPGLYHFIPLPDPPDDPAAAVAAARVQYDRAVALQPDAPRYRIARARNKVTGVRRTIRSIADQIIRERMPLIAEQKSSAPDAYAAFRVSIEPAAWKQVAADPAALAELESAAEDLRVAIRLAPTTPYAHLGLAECLSLQAILAAERGEAFDPLPARAAARRAAELAPNLAAVLQRAAGIHLRHAAQLTGPLREESIGRAIPLIKHSIYVDPLRFASDGLEMLRSAGVPDLRLIEATPETLLAYHALWNFFWKRRAWDMVAEVLDRMQELAEEDVDHAPLRAAPDTDPRDDTTAGPDESLNEEAGAPELPSFAPGSDSMPVWRRREQITRLRAFVLGLLGRWDHRLHALDQLAELRTRHLRPQIDEADSVRVAGRHSRAIRLYADVLDQLPHHPEALIGLARIVRVPYFRDQAPVGYGPLECLLRAVRENPTLTADQVGRCHAVLDYVPPESARDRVIAAVIRHGAVVRRLDAPEARDRALAALLQLAEVDEPALKSWQQRHVLWELLGQGYERAGKPDAADRMYTKVLELVPAHRAAVRHRLRIAEDRGDAAAAEGLRRRLAELTPRQPARATFRGTLRLLGYEVRTAPDAESPAVVYFWEIVDELPDPYQIQTTFYNSAWRPVVADRRPLSDGSLPGPMPVRLGEVVVEVRPLNIAAIDAPFIDVRVVAQDPPRGWPIYLPCDAGRGRARFRFVQAAPRPRKPGAGTVSPAVTSPPAAP
jgi:O-antigen ligase